MNISNVCKLVLLALATSAICAHALDPDGPVARVDGTNVVDARAGGLPERYADTFPYRSAGDARWLADGWRTWVQATPCASNEQVASRSWSIDATQAVESVVCETAPVSAPYEAVAAQLHATWPMLEDHPATNDIPAGGLAYRINGDPITWWIVRQSDQLATQVSAHDAAGNPIVRTINLKTGEDTTINLQRITTATRFQDLRDAKTTTNRPARRVSGER